MQPKHLILTALAVSLLAAFLSGCAQPRQHIVGHSVENRPIECVVYGQGDDVALIMATIHGDEPAGTPLVQQLGEHLRQNPGLLSERTAVLMPVANPDGLARGTRHNVHGVDLNRNFPSDNFEPSLRHGPEPLSEPESGALLVVLEEYTPDRIVSIHQPFECIDYDGPAKELAEAMGRRCELPVKRIGSRPGSLGSYAGITLDIPIITLELPESASQLTPEELWGEYGPMLVEAVTFSPRPR